jgi:5-methyltetrahydrofolate--homocysteine methyltransferase
MIEVVRHLRAKTSKPIWAKANAGAPKLVDGRTVFPETPEEMAGRVPELIRAGANVIGGCCGTTPAHIRAIASQVRNLRGS